MAKIKYKKVRNLTPTEASYIAGIIDGEGSISLTRQSQGGQRRIGTTIDNTDFYLLKQLLNIIEAGKITKKNPYRPEDRVAYVYHLYSQQALDLLAQILPYLRTYKQKRAKLVLENYKKLTPRNGKYSKKVLIERDGFIKAFFSITQHGTQVRHIKF